MKAFPAIITLSLFLHVAFSSRVTQAESKPNDCQVCQYVMKFIRHQTLQQALPLSAVKEKLTELYKILPSSVKNEEFLTNIDVFVSMIKEGKDPQTICKFLGKCRTMKPEQLDASTECEVCTAVVDLIKFDLMISNITVQVIIKAVQVLCALIGDVPVYEECKLILSAINQIIQWLEDKVDPKDICIRLHLCPNTTKITRLNNDRKITCQIVVRNLRAQSLKGWTEKKMEEKIAPICKKLGLNIFHCYHIKTNLKTIIALIKKGQESEEVCGNRIKPHKDNNLKLNQPSYYCEFCMMIMETVIPQLGHMETGLDGIETKFKQVCNDLEDLTQECNYVVGLVFDDLERNVKYVKSLLDPSATCKALKLCPKSLEY